MFWHKKCVPLLLTVLSILAVLSSCSGETSKSKEIVFEEEVPALARYLEFMENSLTDLSGAIEEYCHYEDADRRELAVRQNYQIINYEILGYEKLSEQLWIITNFAADEANPDGEVLEHFVGLIDGEYYVMISLRQVPPILQEGLDLSEYERPDLI